MYSNCMSDVVIKYGEFAFHNVMTTWTSRYIWQSCYARRQLLLLPLLLLHQSLSAVERQRSTTHISVTEGDKNIHRSLLFGGGLHAVYRLPIA